MKIVWKTFTIFTIFLGFTCFNSGVNNFVSTSWVRGSNLFWKQGKSKREGEEGLEVNFDCKINTPYISRKANKDNCKKILERANRK